MNSWGLWEGRVAIWQLGEGMYVCAGSQQKHTARSQRSRTPPQEPYQTRRPKQATRKHNVMIM